MGECNVHNEVGGGVVVEYVATFWHGKSRLDVIEVLGVHQQVLGDLLLWIVVIPSSRIK